MLELSHAFTLLYIKVSSFYISSFKYKHISVFIDILYIYIYIFILGKKDWILMSVFFHSSHFRKQCPK